MAYPNTLIFVDLPSPDPVASAKFYGEVFGWEVEGRPEGAFHRIVPGDEFLLDGGERSGVGNLHMGIYQVDDSRPDPNDTPAWAAGKTAPAQPSGPLPRIYILVSDDDDLDKILNRAEERGAEILWRDAYWGEFNGFHGSFRDPWGVQIVLWNKGGDDPQIPDHFHRA